MMGKKCIVEMKEGERLYKTKLNALNEPVIREITCEPYTEPDTEAAYAHGYSNAEIKYRAEVKEAYQKGLSDAWDAARKVVALSTVDRRKVFGSEYMYSILEKHTAVEAIEKIRQYEQKKEEQIQVGDEVKLKCGVGPAIYMQGSNGSDEIYLLFNDGSCGFHRRSEIECKTGRHFPEIAEVLRKMKEE